MSLYSFFLKKIGMFFHIYEKNLGKVEQNGGSCGIYTIEEYMKCQNQPAFLVKRNEKIANLWEVRIQTEIWNKICHAAQVRKVTKSWIVRFCLFRLCREVQLKSKMGSQIREAQLAKITGPAHRHLLCLYGRDEMVIRFIAAETMVTITALIRVAVDLYLDSLIAHKVSNQDLFEHGIKITLKLNAQFKEIFFRPMTKTFKLFGFPKDRWWRARNFSVQLDFVDKIICSEIFSSE